MAGDLRDLKAKLLEAQKAEKKPQADFSKTRASAHQINIEEANSGSVIRSISRT